MECFGWSRPSFNEWSGRLGFMAPNGSSVTPGPITRTPDITAFGTGEPLGIGAHERERSARGGVLAVSCGDEGLDAHDETIAVAVRAEDVVNLVVHTFG